MDFYNLTFKVPKGRGLESRDQISKFWDPVQLLNEYSYPLQIWYRHRGRTYRLRVHHKTTLSGRGQGHMTYFPISGPP